MSMGYGAFVRLVAYDDRTVLYKYGSYNLNKQGYENYDRICDGLITISKDCFIEPEIHSKIKKMPSGRKKLITKRIPVNVDYAKMIDEGEISVENCSNCWKFRDNKNIDAMVFLILFKLFNQYQLNGEIPENISLNA